MCAMLTAVYDAEIVMLVFSGLIFLIPTPPFQTSISRHPLPYFQRNISLVIIFANCIFIAIAIALNLTGVRSLDDDEEQLYTTAAFLALLVTVALVIFCVAYRLYQSCASVCCYRCTRSNVVCGALCRQLVGAGRAPTAFEEQVFAPLIAVLLTGFFTSMLPDMPPLASAFTYIAFVAVLWLSINCIAASVSVILVAIEFSVLVCTSLTVAATCVIEGNDLFVGRPTLFYVQLLGIIIGGTLLHILWNYTLTSLFGLYQYHDDDIDDFGIHLEDSISVPESVLKKQTERQAVVRKALRKFDERAARIKAAKLKMPTDIWPKPPPPPPTDSDTDDDDMDNTTTKSASKPLLRSTNR